MARTTVIVVYLTTKRQPILKRQVTWRQIIPLVESNNQNSEGIQNLFATCFGFKNVLLWGRIHGMSLR